MAERAVDVVVAGGGGFIGGHLVGDLLGAGLSVRSVDIEPTEAWHQVHPDAENLVLDVALLEAARTAVDGAAEVYNLAAAMGGMGFIEDHKAECMLSVLPSTHMLLAAKEAEAQRYYYASSACVYAANKQLDVANPSLREADAYPADPEDGYGWEKLFSERMCRHFAEDFDFAARVGRIHNVYGPYGPWTGGKEKAPAAVCRKIATAAITGEHELEIWGDGEQTRSFIYVDDCVHGSKLVMAGDTSDPINLGSDELVSINQLVDLVEQIAGVRCHRNYKLDAPQGVRGRNSENSLIADRFGWAPSIPLADGLEQTYRWIYDQVKRQIA